jgi:hypothetical protein
MEGQHTQPVLDELLLDRAGGAVSHDLEEGSHLAPTEAIGQFGQLVLGVGFLEVARRPMRAFATCSTVIMSVSK